MLLEKSGEYDVSALLELEEQNRQLKIKVATLQGKFSGSPKNTEHEKQKQRIQELEAELEQIKKDGQVHHMTREYNLNTKDSFKVHRSHQAMIVQLETKKKDLQKKLTQIEQEREAEREQYTKGSTELLLSLSSVERKDGHYRQLDYTGP